MIPRLPSPLSGLSMISTFNQKTFRTCMTRNLSRFMPRDHRRQTAGKEKVTATINECRVIHNDRRSDARNRPSLLFWRTELSSRHNIGFFFWSSEFGPKKNASRPHQHEPTKNRKIQAPLGAADERQPTTVTQHQFIPVSLDVRFGQRVIN